MGDEMKCVGIIIIKWSIDVSLLLSLKCVCFIVTSLISFIL